MGTLQALLHLINLLANKIGLKFISNKCCTMHYSSRPPAACRDTIFNLSGNDVPCIRDGVPAIYLGEPIGAFLPRDFVTFENVKQRATIIMTSKLGPW